MKLKKKCFIGPSHYITLMINLWKKLCKLDV